MRDLTGGGRIRSFRYYKAFVIDLAGFERSDSLLCRDDVREIAKYESVSFIQRLLQTLLLLAVITYN